MARASSNRPARRHTLASVSRRSRRPWLSAVGEAPRVLAEPHGRLLEDEADAGAVELELEEGLGEPGVLPDEPLERLGQADLEVLPEVEHLELGLRRAPRAPGAAMRSRRWTAARGHRAGVDGEHLGPVAGEHAGGEHASTGLEVLAVVAASRPLEASVRHRVTSVPWPRRGPSQRSMRTDIAAPGIDGRMRSASDHPWRASN